MLKKMINLAFQAKEKAYTPYSGFKVGATVLSEGDLFTGCNIENASYTPTVCAERTAIFKAISEGKRSIDKIVVVADEEDVYPCGVCRQVIREFAPDCEIIIANSESDYKVYNLKDLLPNSFGPNNLKGRDI